jgi:hypothetical protein
MDAVTMLTSLYHPIPHSFACWVFTLSVQAPQWMADSSEGLLAVLKEAADLSLVPHPEGLVSDV